MLNFLCDILVTLVHSLCRFNPLHTSTWCYPL